VDLGFLNFMLFVGSVLYYANPYIFHYFLWECHFSFTPTFSRTQVGRKTRVWC